jgi:hypothetical protein
LPSFSVFVPYRCFVANDALFVENLVHWMGYFIDMMPMSQLDNHSMERSRVGLSNHEGRDWFKDCVIFFTTDPGRNRPPLIACGYLRQPSDLMVSVRFTSACELHG